MLVDVERQLQVPQCNVATAETRHGVFNFTEVTIPFEDVIEEAFERKKLKYGELVAEVRE